MNYESIKVRFSDSTEKHIPSDKSVILDDSGDPFIVGFVNHKATKLNQPHVFVVIGAKWDQEAAIYDHHATRVYIYPHRDLEETCKLIGIDIASLPITDIEFNNQTENISLGSVSTDQPQLLVTNG